MLDCRAQDHEIKAHALYSIGRVKALLAGISNMGPVTVPYVTHDGLKRLGWEQPAPQAMRLHATTSEGMGQDLDRIATDCNAKPCAPNIAIQGRIARMCDPAWWVRNLRRETVKENETIQHAAGDIRRKAECYATNHAVKIKAERAKANRATLEGLEVVNEDGIALNLQEVADKSVSNPTIRRGELMVRARGFEETAELYDHAAYFITLTCPTRFHRFNASGKKNRAWEGATPREAQDYLCEVWGKIRAAWGRKKIMPYGFRVCEPHHDGCPHWHILLFFDPVFERAASDFIGPVRPRATAPRLCAIVRRYILDQDLPAEQAINQEIYEQVYNRFPYRYAYQAAAAAAPVAAAALHAWKVGARQQQNRDSARKTHAADFKRIDTTKGSATGYIAKYISKNIDGLQQDGNFMGLDEESGQVATTSAQRVKTWASTWGIRQFQQIGGPSVSVYRELRRLGEVTEAAWAQPDLFTPYQDAADQANWFVYWGQQGGPTVPRRKLTLKPAYTTDLENKYGEDVSRIMGITHTSATEQASLKTRAHTWTVQVAGLADIDAAQAIHRDDMARAAAVERFYREAGLSGHSEFLALGAPCAPWTGVNNCTAPLQNSHVLHYDILKPKFDFEGFEHEPWAIAYKPENNRRGDPETVAAEVAILEKETWHQKW
jgi:hypothetical protein